MWERGRPPHHPSTVGGYNPSLLYSPPSEKEIKTLRSIDTGSHFCASSARAQVSSDDTGISPTSSQPADISFKESHRYPKFLLLTAAY